MATRYLGRVRLHRLAVLLFVSVWTWQASAAQQVGEVVYAKGVATAQVAEEPVRLLGTGASLVRGDVITTAARSWAVFNLNDGTRMTVRPNSVFSLKEYSDTEDDSNAVMQLFKGGLRAITGLISKRNPNGFKLQTSVATIGIRGTDFEARLCTEDCQKEVERRKQAASAAESPVAARVVFLKGRVTARRRAGEKRRLTLGASLYAGDRVETLPNAVAVLAFEDESRVTLQSSTLFQIKKANYTPAEPEEDSMVLGLLKGGLRAVTGLIGKRNKDAFRVATPTATIGIRGTGFDVVCEGRCEGEQVSRFTPDFLFDPLEQLFELLVPTAWAQEFTVRVVVFFWQGFGFLENSAGTHAVDQGAAGFAVSETRAPEVFIGTLPEAMQQLQQNTPNPASDEAIDESIRPQLEDLFSSRDIEEVPEETLIVLVTEGDVEVSNEKGTVQLGANESAIVGGEIYQAPTRVTRVLVIPLPSPDQISGPTSIEIPGITDDLEIEFRDDGQICVGV